MDREKPSLFYVYQASATAAFGGFLQSYVTCVIAGSLSFIAEEFGLNAFHQGYLASLILLGALTGSCFAGAIADWLGRKTALQIAAFLFCASSLGVFFSSSYSSLLFYRWVAGVAAGISAILVPLYLAEIAPSSSRGGFVSMFQLAVTIGTLAAYLVNILFQSSGHWRAMLGFAAPIAFFQGLALVVVPETPVWLFGKGKMEEGKKNLIRLQGVFAPMVYRETKTSLLRAVFTPLVRPLLWIGLLLATFQQLSGINAVIYFSPKIFTEAGVVNPMFPTLVVAVVNILATLGSLFLVDRWGRKKLLILSQLGIVIALFVIFLGFATNVALVDLLAVGAVLLYVGFYSVGIGPVTWVVISEIFPFAIRAKAMAVMTFFSWLTNYVVVLTFPLLLQSWGAAGSFFMYWVLGILGLLLFFRFVPETKGSDLENNNDSSQ